MPQRNNVVLRHYSEKAREALPEQCLSGIEGHSEDTRIYQCTFDQQSGQIVYTSSNTTYEVFAYVAKLRLNFVQSNQGLT
jgi:hypothetical protein